MERSEKNDHESRTHDHATPSRDTDSNTHHSADRQPDNVSLEGPAHSDDEHNSNRHRSSRRSGSGSNDDSRRNQNRRGNKKDVVDVTETDDETITIIGITAVVTKAERKEISSNSVNINRKNRSIPGHRLKRLVSLKFRQRALASFARKTEITNNLPMMFSLLPRLSASMV